MLNLKNLSPIKPKKIVLINGLGIITLATKEIKRIFSVWIQTIASPAFAGILLVTLISVNFARHNDDIEGFISFVVPGVIITYMLQNAFSNTSSVMILYKIQGVIFDLLTIPLNAAEVVIGLVLGGLFRGLFLAIFMFILFFLVFDLNYQYNYLAIILIALNCSITLGLTGLLSGIYCNSFDQQSLLSNFFIIPFSFLSGAFYQFDYLSEWIRNITLINPFYYMVRIFRASFNGASFGDIWIEMLAIFLLNVLLFSACCYSFRRHLTN